MNAVNERLPEDGLLAAEPPPIDCADWRSLLATRRHGAPCGSDAQPLFELYGPLCRVPRATAFAVAHLAQSIDGRIATTGGVSRWLSGKSTPDSTTIGKILECLPDEYQSDMLTAYLRDQIPPRFEPLVQIDTKNGGKLRIEEGAPELPEALGPELRKQVVFFAKLALRWQEVRKILELFYTIAHKGKPARLKKLVE
jgi:hypothetical protein